MKPLSSHRLAARVKDGSLIGSLLLAASAWGAELSSITQSNLTELPLEALLQLEVTSVSRKPEKLSQSPAAIGVITQDDIRRSGANSIPQALRLAPGLQAAQLDSSEWAISSRGFNDVFANKLLVLQDGRSIYTPLFSGVFWDVQGTLMEDIERIEVIRGPGATLWGANAVNGVINIITRSAKETQGTLLAGGGGSEERAFGAVRYGDRLSEHAFFRVYGTYFNIDESALPDGAGADDAWQLGRWGFRVDWDVSDHDLLTLQGDAYRGEVDQVFGTYDPSDTNNLLRIVHDEFEVTGGNFLGRWTHWFAEDSDLRVQAYYDRTERDSVLIEEKRDTFDIDFQHRFLLGERHDWVWGAGYRLTADDIRNTETISFDPDHRTLDVVSAFVQDEIVLWADQLRLTLGSKFEYNDLTGFEVQPGARLLWTPTEHQSAWLSVARAVRTPSRAEADVKLNRVMPGAPTVVTTIYGSRQVESEELVAYEIGYRIQPHARVSVDLAAFYNDYDSLRSLEPGPSPTQPVTTPPPPGIPVPLHAANELYGETYGFEAALSVELTSWWRLQPSYTFLEMQLHKRSGSGDLTSELDEGKSPENQFMLRSSMDLPGRLTLDCLARYVDELPSQGIGSYITLDVRLAWLATPNLQLAVVGQNLLNNQHPEIRPSLIATRQTEIERGVYGKISWRF